MPLKPRNVAITAIVTVLLLSVSYLGWRGSNLLAQEQDTTWQPLVDAARAAELTRIAEAQTATIQLPLIWPPDGHEGIELLVRVSDISTVHAKPYTRPDGEVAYGSRVYMNSGKVWEVDVPVQELSIELVKLGWGETAFFEPLSVE